MIINQSFIDFLAEKRVSEGMHYYLSDLVSQKYPQFNSTTKIRLTDQSRVFIAVDHSFDVDYVWLNKRGWKNRLWRSLGELLNKPQWGKECGPNPIMKLVQDTLYLEPIQMQDLFAKFILLTAYYPTNDTLYVRFIR